MGFSVRLMFCDVVLSVLSFFVISLLRMKELVTLHLLCSCYCVMRFCGLSLFLMVPRVGQWYLIVACPGHTYFAFSMYCYAE